MIVAVPTHFASTTPLVTVATDGLSLLHVTALSKFTSSGNTVALSVLVCPSTMPIAFSERSMLLSTTVIVHVAVSVPAVAITTAGPAFSAVTLPDWSIDTTSLNPPWIDHFTVGSFASLGDTVAVILELVFGTIFSIVGFSVNPVTGCSTVTTQLALMLSFALSVAVIVAVPAFTPVTTP